jgi:mannosyltransferase OCH1-like enzyme
MTRPIKKLHQIWITDGDQPPGEYVSTQIARLKHMYSDWEYTMYNKSDLLDFIVKNFDSDVALAFEKVKPYAFKADLGRYCLLYQFGGYYFDAAICPKFRYQHDDFAYILQGEPHTIDGKLCHALDNGIMYFREPHSPFLKSAIEKSVDNILSHRYGRNPLDITGPLMLYDLDHSMIKKFPYSVVEGKKVTCIDGQIWFEYQHGFSAVPFDSHVWKNNTKINREEAKGTNSYSQMWRDKSVFSDYNKMIKKIHQIYISENNQPPSEPIQQQMAKVKELYSGWKYNLYDNEQCRQEIDSIFGKKVVDLYDTLNAFSFRADLARYCILYKYGGQYFDASICPEFKLEFEDTAILYEPPGEWGNGNRLIDNGVMIFNKTEHPLLLKAIQISIKNIRDKNYGTGALDITGPRMLGKIEKFNDVTYGYCKHITPKQKAAFLNEKMHWKYKPDSSTLKTFDCTGINSYEELYTNRQVFADK